MSRGTFAHVLESYERAPTIPRLLEILLCRSLKSFRVVSQEGPSEFLKPGAIDLRTAYVTPIPKQDTS